MNNISLDYITSQALNIVTLFLVAFIPTVVGVYAKEHYEISQKKSRKKINVKNVMATALTISCVAVGGISYFDIINKWGMPITFSFLFLIGAFSNKVIEMIFNGSLLKIAFKFLGKSKDNLQSSIEETIKETGDDKKE